MPGFIDLLDNFKKDLCVEKFLSSAQWYSLFESDWSRYVWDFWKAEDLRITLCRAKAYSGYFVFFFINLTAGLFVRNF